MGGCVRTSIPSPIRQVSQYELCTLFWDCFADHVHGPCTHGGHCFDCFAGCTKSFGCSASHATLWLKNESLGTSQDSRLPTAQSLAAP